MTNSNIPVIVQPGQGDAFQAFGNTLSVLLSGGQTGGRIAVMSDEV